MESVRCKISSKGQLTIPKEFRDKLGIGEGDEVIVHLSENILTITPPPYHIGMLRGLLADEIDMERAEEFIKKEREKWRV